MEVSHPGEVTPLAALEPILTTYIFSAWRVGRPLSVGEIYQLGNSLLHKSELEAEFIQWKMKRGLWDPLNPGSLGGDDESYDSQLDAEDADEGLVFEDKEVEETEENEEDADEE